MIHETQYIRFRMMARIEHFILMVSFSLLAITGLPQKYPDAGISRNIIALFGGIEGIRIIHRYAAFVLVMGSVFHLLTIGYRLFVKREKMRIMFNRKDWTDLKDTIRFNLGFTDTPPQMDKFNFGEKFEYWAVIWGTAIMALTGFVLWNPIASATYLPGQIIPAALEAHGGEALLAVLAILIWHIYNVHIKHFNPSIFTGKLPRHQMEEEHTLELARLEAGGEPFLGLHLPAEARRRRIFFVASMIISVVAFALVVWAATFEETAITTIPRVTRDIFVPLTTPAP